MADEDANFDDYYYDEDYDDEYGDYDDELDGNNQEDLNEYD